MLDHNAKKTWLIVIIVLAVCLIIIPAGLIGGGLLIYKLQATSTSSGYSLGKTSGATDYDSRLLKNSSTSQISYDAVSASMDAEGAVTAAAPIDNVAGLYASK